MNKTRTLRKSLHVYEAGSYFKEFRKLYAPLVRRELYKKKIQIYTTTELID